MMTKEKWYCYICGKKLGKDFILWSMDDRTDRVFLVHSKEMCAHQIGSLSDPVIKVKVKRVDD